MQVHKPNTLTKGAGKSVNPVDDIVEVRVVLHYPRPNTDFVCLFDAQGVERHPRGSSELFCGAAGVITLLVVGN